MKVLLPATLMLLVASGAFADPLRCNLSQYAASTGLTAVVQQDVLTVTWAGDAGSELRARYVIDERHAVGSRAGDPQGRRRLDRRSGRISCPSSGSRAACAACRTSRCSRCAIWAWRLRRKSSTVRSGPCSGTRRSSCPVSPCRSLDRPRGHHPRSHSSSASRRWAATSACRASPRKSDTRPRHSSPRPAT